MKELKLRCKNWEKYQFYKKHNKNYSNEQPWFMMYGRKLLGERKYMELKPEERDFLVTGSQDNGFLPSPKDIAFKMRIDDVEQVNQYLKLMLEHEWLEEVAAAEYNEIMTKVHEQVEENQRENGLAKVKKESIHDQARKLSQKMSINNG